MRDLDDIRVKGKNEPVKVFELMLPEKFQSQDQAKKFIADFEKGRAHYKKQEWDLASGCFEECLKPIPNDGPCEMYIERLTECKKENLPKDWDGVHNFTHK
jgi:adenylate cyclase